MVLGGTLNTIDFSGIRFITAGQKIAIKGAST